MTGDRWLDRSERWLRLLLRLYPADFREDLGPSLVETYRDRCRAVLQRSGPTALFSLWLGALADSIRNGLGERLRPAIRWRRRGNWGHDMEIAIRRLVRAPLFVTSVTATLAVGLGVFAVVAAVVYHVLLAPLPYQRPDDLYFVWRDYRAFFDLDRGWLGGPDVSTLAASGVPIVGAAGLGSDRRTLTAAGSLDPVEISVMVTTPNLFDLLGVKPALGRVFAATEGGPGRPPLVVLTHPLWRNLGGDGSVVGSEVRLNGEPYTVIGVLSERFGFRRHASLGPPTPADAYVTFTQRMAVLPPSAGSYAGLIRVAPGTPRERVEEAVAAVGRTVDRRDFSSRGLKLYPVGMHEDLIAPVRPALRMLAAAGLLLVLVLAVNLSTLLLARTMQREREIAVSRALGANPVAVMRATLVEGATLGALGGAAAALAAVWATRALVALAPAELPLQEQIRIDWRLGLGITGAGLVLGLLAAALPALWSARVRLSALLSSAAVRGGGARGHLRRSLVVAQVALCLMLLGTAGLVVRNLGRLLQADPGFDPAGAISVRVPLSGERYADSMAVLSVHERLAAALAGLPGVRAVSATTDLPLAGTASQSPFGVPGAPRNTGRAEHDRPLVDYFGVRPGYFEVLRIRMIAGRDVGPRGGPGLPEAVVDRPFAEHFFPSPEAALGARIPFGDPDTVVVVGVVEQARHYDIDRDGRPQLFVQADDWGYRALSWVLRSERPVAALGPEIRDAIHRVDPGLAVTDLQAMTEIRDQAVSQERVSAVMIAGFGLGALVLAAMGLFGIVAGTVTRRSHELAVRLALGADHGRVLRLVLSDGMRLVWIGVLIGAPGVWLAGRLAHGLLEGISPGDPLAFGGAAVGLGVVAAVACYLPARRVLRIEPARMLRDDAG